MRVSFILNGDSRSGGVRVTVVMGNILRRRGYGVRIVHPHPHKDLWRALRYCLARLRGKVSKNGPVGWFSEFDGDLEAFTDLNDLRFEVGEVVIAVGTMAFEHLVRLNAPVVKLRYNHGLPPVRTENAMRAWRGQIPTITVSRTLVPKLEEIMDVRVMAVVPNGVSPAEYYVENGVLRDGLGAVYSSDPWKAPRDLIRVLQEAQCLWPNLPQYLFSLEAQPNELRHCSFWCNPSTAQARAIYNRARIWLVPSYSEGFGLPVLEAMACGCVVISSDSDGGRELVSHEENGMIVPRGDVGGFIREIERVIGDPDLCERLAAAGRATAARLSWESAADKMEDALEELTGSAQGVARL